jgi:hypothetical protein
MKGVAMSAGRGMLKEFYVGFLLLLLSFLYLSHLTKSEAANLRLALSSRTLEAKATAVVAANEKEYY